MLEFSFDGGDLLVRKECLLLLGERLVDGGGDLGVDFDDGELPRQDIGGMLKAQ